MPNQVVGFCNGGAVPTPTSGLTYSARTVGDNGQQSVDKPANNAGYKGMTWLLNIFCRAFPYFSPSQGTPYSGQLFPRSSGGVGSSGQNNPE